MSISSAEIRQKIYPFFLYFPRYENSSSTEKPLQNTSQSPQLKLKINKLTCIKPGTVYAENDNPENARKIYKPA